MRQYAVFRHPNHILVGVEPETFNVIQLGERYGTGDYEIAIFDDGKETRRVRQYVSKTFGPPKMTEQLPDDTLPSAK